MSTKETDPTINPEGELPSEKDFTPEEFDNVPSPEITFESSGNIYILTWYNTALYKFGEADGAFDYIIHKTANDKSHILNSNPRISKLLIDNCFPTIIRPTVDNETVRETLIKIMETTMETELQNLLNNQEELS